MREFKFKAVKAAGRRHVVLVILTAHSRDVQGMDHNLLTPKGNRVYSAQCVFHDEMLLEPDARWDWDVGEGVG